MVVNQTNTISFQKENKKNIVVLFFGRKLRQNLESAYRIWRRESSRICITHLGTANYSNNALVRVTTEHVLGRRMKHEQKRDKINFTKIEEAKSLHPAVLNLSVIDAVKLVRTANTLPLGMGTCSRFHRRSTVHRCRRRATMCRRREDLSRWEPQDESHECGHHAVKHRK